MMKKSFLLFLLIFTLNFDGSAQTGEGIIWQKDYQQALLLSKETGKPLLIDFTAVWCKPCQEMEKTFWVRGDVIETMKSFVAVKIDYDKEKPLVNRFSVRGLPYIAFSDPIGNLIAYRKGFGQKTADDLSEILKEMPNDFSPLKKAYDAIEIRKNDGLALRQIADFYSSHGLLRLSNEFYERASRTIEVNKSEENRERIAAAVGLNYYLIADYKQSNDHLEKYLKSFPSGKKREVAVAALAVGNANLGNFKEADKYLEMLKTEFPASKSLPTALKFYEAAKAKK